jgi:hypothetical protein
MDQGWLNERGTYGLTRKEILYLGRLKKAVRLLKLSCSHDAVWLTHE